MEIFGLFFRCFFFIQTLSVERKPTKHELAQNGGNDTTAKNNDTFIITNETDPNCTHKIQVFTKQGGTSGSSTEKPKPASNGEGDIICVGTDKAGTTTTQNDMDEDIIIVKDNGSIAETVSQCSSVDGNESEVVLVSTASVTSSSAITAPPTSSE